MRAAPRLAVLLAAGLLLLAAGAPAADAPAPEQRAARPVPAGAVSLRGLDRNIMLLQSGLAVAALGVLGWSHALARSGRPRRQRGARRAALCVLAATSFCANFHFFVWTRLHEHEFFHYYLGAKYAPELGYFGIYRCSLAAGFEQGFDDPQQPFFFRDLRSNELRAANVLAPTSARCDGAFSSARWQAFKSDIARFRDLLEPRWRRVLWDHGFNPTPVYTLFARPLTEVFPAYRESLFVLARLDLVLVLGVFAAIGWAFGLEAACVAAIAWGANPNSRYLWIGDAFLRSDWLAPSMLGLCLLRKGWYRGAGVCLTLAALLRIFPGLFFAGYVLREALRLVRERRLDPGFRRFALASLAAGLVLVTASAAASGRGAGSWLEFAEKLSTVTALVATNNVGLKQLATFTSERPEPEPVDGRPLVTRASMEALQAKIFAERRLQYFGALAVFLALFFRASRTALDWEAAAMGSTLMLVLTTPASYYLSFVLSAAMLATRRPRIGMALMLTLAAWCLGFASIGRGPLPFVFSSAVGLLFFLYVLVELQLAPAPPAAPERPTAR